MQIKRDDLQCWRAFSILAVLLFHIWPSSFPNGYVGVDIFFVLSGYLMAMIFPTGKKIQIKDFKNFYFRRIKRIVPLYLVIILITLFFLAKSTLLREYQEIKNDSKWAIGFVSNFQDAFTKLNYFNSKSKHRFFRHCWSLAVEMQFYLIFPFVGLLRTKVNKQIYQLFLLIIFFASITYQLTSNDQITKYESLFCRIWQFTAGILAQTVIIKPFTWITYGLSVITIGLMFMPFSVINPIISLLVIIFAATTIVLSSAETHPFKKLIPYLNIYQYFVFLGDISYILYLIHWPIITYAFSINPSNHIHVFDGTLIAVTCLVLATFAHKIIEKPLLKFCNDFKKFIVTLGVLYFLVLLLPELFKHLTFDTTHQCKKTFKFLKSTENFDKSSLKFPQNWTTKNDIEATEWMTKVKAGLGFFIKCNYKHSIHLPEMPKNLDYCEYNTNPEATLTAIIIGNSYALNLQYAIVKNPAFRKVILIYALGCPFPYVKEKGKKHCKKIEEAMKRIIGEIEPDIVYLFQAYIGYMKNSLKKNWKNNWKFKKWTETFQFIQKHSSAIIINQEQLYFPYEIGIEFSKRKFHGIAFDGKMKKPENIKSLEQRLSALHCPKCFWLNYKSVFCGQNFCNSLDADTGLPLFYDKNHVTILGLRKIKPAIDKVTEKALTFIKSKKITYSN